MLGLSGSKKSVMIMFSRFDRIPACDRDRQTDRRADRHLATA